MSASVHLAKRAGLPWDRIGQVLGVSPQEAHRMHAAYMAEMTGPQAPRLG